MAEDFLARVRREKELRLASLPPAVPEAELRRRAAPGPPARPFAAALLGARPAIIAEVKRRSPSAGEIRQVSDPARVARAMARGGAAAISVLTEELHFGGSLDDLRLVRERVPVPVLRKDFLLRPAELHEARAAGADAALLIVALLGAKELAGMLAAGREAGLECLVEVHDRAELDTALEAGATLVGINNRNLRTLEVDLGTALSLAPLVPPGVVAVGESGYRTPEDIQRGMGAGIAAFLVGESVMRAADPEAAVRRLAEAAG